MAWTADRYVGEARPINWLCKGTIPLGIPALVAAMGGLGKSYLALDLALQIAAGVAGLEQPKLILGGRIAVEGTAVIITAEDSFDAVHRRLNRIDPTSRRLRHPRRLIVLPLPDAGGARPLIANTIRRWHEAYSWQSSNVSFWKSRTCAWSSSTRCRPSCWPTSTPIRLQHSSCGRLWRRSPRQPAQPFFSLITCERME